MLTVSISGGLGNQMFQYAFGYSYTRKNKENLQFDVFYISLDKQRKYELDKYNISYKNNVFLKGMIYYFIRYFIKKFCKTDKKLQMWNQVMHTVVEDVFMCFQEIEGNNLFAIGYWMNLNYFQAYRGELLNEYKYCGRLENNQQHMLDKIKGEESLAIHVRRGDYLKNRLYKVIEKDYYVQALRYLKSKKNITNIYFFSDDINWCKDEYRDIQNITFIDSGISGDAHVDLEMMRNCKYFIIANSTFSWWGAWLSEREGKIMIAPEKWFDEERYDSYNERIRDSLLRDFIIM